MVAAQYFDGTTTRVHRVELSLAGDRLTISGDGIDLGVPFAEVRVDERLGRAARRLRLSGGAFCEVGDLDALEALLAAAGHRDRSVERLQRGLKSALLAGAACVALAASFYVWGLPWLAEIGARNLPPAIGRTLSTQALKVLDGQLLRPSRIGDERQAAILARYRALRLPEGGAPAADLLFRDSPTLGANAFTLPDGKVVLLDGLVEAVGDDDRILAVLAHELGHAHGRHGLQLLLRSSVIGAFWTFYVGDISQLLAGAPAILIDAKYSRDLERQADEYGAALLEANGLSPALLADALQALANLHPGLGEIPFLANHPATDDRIAALRRRKA